MRSLVLSLVLIAVAGCDASTDGLVLDGTYRGSGQSEVVSDAAPLRVAVDLALTFDAAGPGPVSADLTMTTTVAGTPPETFTGTARGTLSADGALALTAAPSSASATTKALFDGTATATRLTGTLSGGVRVAGLALTR